VNTLIGAILGITAIAHPIGKYGLLCKLVKTKLLIAISGKSRHKIFV
jgi:hypothetical protein